MNHFSLIDLGIDIYRGDAWIAWCPAENISAAKEIYPEADGYRFGDRRRISRNPEQQEPVK